jgi:uncharacterized membrane protein
MSTIVRPGRLEGGNDEATRGPGDGALQRARTGTADEAREGRSTGGRGNAESLANALGWFSLGLGVAQIAAPRSMARFIGIDDDRGRDAMRMVGAREVAAGLGILSRPRPAGWMWTRVAGDVMDLALLRGAYEQRSRERGRTAAATAAVLGITALDVLCGRQLARGEATTAPAATRERGTHVARSITVRRPVEEVYRFWRDVANLPRFMRHLESVQRIDDRRSHWTARAPAGGTVEWDAEITEELPNERIAWRSVEDADVQNVGSVRFVPAPGGRGTEVHVELSYAPPAGKVGATIARLLHEEPGQQVADDLRAFKQVMEVGEVVLSDATVHRGPHPAQPTEGGR